MIPIYKYLDYNFRISSSVLKCVKGFIERVIALNHLSIHVGCVFFLAVAPLARRVAGESDSEAEPGHGLLYDWMWLKGWGGGRG
jgi:hypothetical protein